MSITCILPSVVEDAAEVCSIKAWWWATHEHGSYEAKFHAGPAFQTSVQTDTVYAWMLADAAFSADVRTPITAEYTMADAWAEAESKLRTGWLPDGWRLIEPR